MKRIACRILTAIALLGGAALVHAAETESSWPTWRGPTPNGVSPDGDPPIEWSETENVRWKIEIPGLGSASPVIWKDHLFVLSAVADAEEMAEYEAAAAAAREAGERFRGPGAMNQDYIVMALSRKDGSVVWKKTAVSGMPPEGRHSGNSWASGSPVTDGEVLIAHFGSAGTFAYDLEGNLLWQVDLGDMSTRNEFGEGASPSLHGDTLVINWDHEGDSFIVALDKNTGEEIWRRDRDEVTSWSTPLIVDVGERSQVIVPATGRTRAYDLETGDEVWSLAGMTLNTIPSPTYSDGVVYLISGFRGAMLQAVDLAHAKGEVEETEALLWSYERDTPYVPSALLYDDQIYFLKGLNNILTSLSADDGTVVFNEVRIEELKNVWASPVGAAGRVYVVSREGTTVVLEHGDEYKVLAANSLDDGFDATPAIVDNEIYLRGKKYLYCIAAE
jgi:outer membrane protein assembly factor BamB